MTPELSAVVEKLGALRLGAFGQVLEKLFRDDPAEAARMGPHLDREPLGTYLKYLNTLRWKGV